MHTYGHIYIYIYIHMHVHLGERGCCVGFAVKFHGLPCMLMRFMTGACSRKEGCSKLGLVGLRGASVACHLSGFCGLFHARRPSGAMRRYYDVCL